MQTFPFGKYKGEYFEDVPLSYITWAIENTRHPYLVNCLKIHLAERLELEMDTSYHPFMDTNQQKITSIYRSLCKKYHPDTGGNTIAMQAINEFMELLKSNS